MNSVGFIGGYAELAKEANTIWNFDLHSMPEAIQFTEYFGNGGHYDWHQDIGPGELSIRKVSVTIQLSDGGDYQGGDLEFLRGATPEQAIQEVKGLLYYFHLIFFIELLL